MDPPLPPMPTPKIPPPRRRRATAEPRRKVVVDGSNLATEGRSEPDLSQLDDAIGAFLEEYPGFETTDVVVIVDATFGHRIDETERPAYEDAITHGELITPPAGTIGRGDAFILRVAAKASAVVLSNDSFQEFHAEHPWLFDDGRLIGGKPVPGVGWVFAPRLPVRGPRSRAVTTAARRRSRPASTAGDEAESPTPPEDVVEAPAADGAASTRSSRRRRRGRGRGGAANVGAETGAATGAEAAPAGTPLNEPLAFLTFVADHPVGSILTGTVAAFTSHGAHVDVGGMRCHVPLRGLGDPPPARARDVLTKGDVRHFVLVALDAQGRRAELSLASPAQASHAEHGGPAGTEAGTSPARATRAAKAAKAPRAAKDAKATKAPAATKAAKAAKVTKAAKAPAAARAAKVTKAPHTAEPAKAAKAAAKAAKPDKAAAKVAKPPAAAKVAKPTKATKAVSKAAKAAARTAPAAAGTVGPTPAKSAAGPAKAATKATKAVRATKAAKATKAPAAAKAAKAAKVTRATRPGPGAGGGTGPGDAASGHGPAGSLA